tara:strand:+ start:588 stop:812 length:225 start_codon:yes stop_codon:yes gene_type:complete
MKMFATSSLNVDFLSPTGSVGFVVLIVGIVVTAVTIYVFYNVSTDVDSFRDKTRKIEAKKIQEKKIERLYPQRK